MRVEPEFLQRFLVEQLPRLRAFVRLRMPNELRMREAESDVMQQACVRILANSHALEFRGEPALLRWACGAVENTVRDMLKAQRAHRRDPAREVPHGAETLLESYGTLCTPSRIAAAREQVLRIEAAMDRLSPAQRDVVMLSRLVGLSHAEIAEQTGLTPDAVRTHLHRGLARLLSTVETGNRDEP